MNTLSIPTSIRSGSAAAPAFRILDSAVPPRHTSVEWLPAPEPRPAIRIYPAASQRAWLMPPRQGLGERVMFAVLAAAALSGVAYGFICLLNLVQNWALFHAGIATLVQ